MATDDTSGTRNTTFEFLRSFSVVEGVIDEEDDFDVLSPIPETADSPDFSGDILDGADRIDPIHCDGHGKSVWKYLSDRWLHTLMINRSFVIHLIDLWPFSCVVVEPCTPMILI